MIEVGEIYKGKHHEGDFIIVTDVFNKFKIVRYFYFISSVEGKLNTFSRMHEIDFLKYFKNIT